MRITGVLSRFLIGVAIYSLASAVWAARPAGEIGKDWGDPAGQECVDCHATENPGLTQEWNNSQHGQAGVNCLDCHKAEKDDIDAFSHKEQLISIIVSPKDCSRCHQTEFEEMDGSHHSKAGAILASLDNLLGEVVGGPAAVNVGCRQCHGAKIEVFTSGKNKGKPIPTTWPNTGIGRINPDGSSGSCTACHGRHRFSKAQARTPDTCGKCHVGPDHPQIEVYNESKHGIIYRAKMDEMNLESDKWVAGVDYSAAPTCATCHMSRGGDQPKTHNVGERISWTLRPPISQKINLVKLENGDEFDVKEGGAIPKVGEAAKGSKVVEVLTWQDRREKMQEVCAACHSDGVIEGHYKQFDDVVDLYNEKFAEPIAAVMGELKKAGYITPSPVRRQDRMDLVGDLAPRGPSRPSRRLDERSGLHLVARHLRRCQAHLSEVDSGVEGSRNEKGRQREVRRRDAGEVLQADRRALLVLRGDEQRPDRQGPQGLRRALR